MITKDGRQIRTLDDWRVHAGPKRAEQWSEARSAMEVARAWLAVASPQLPPEIAAALLNQPAFGTVTAWSGEPEVRLRFDDRRGEPRNTDLLVRARDPHGDFLIAIEAKADESFGATVAETLAAAAERRLVNARSRGMERVENLAAALLGPRRKGEQQLGRLRYQLLTAVAGAVAVAGRPGNLRTVLLVQEFRTRKTEDEKHAANARDLDAFIHRLSHGTVERVDAGAVHGPFEIPGAPLFDVVPPLYIGKTTRDVPAS